MSEDYEIWKLKAEIEGNINWHRIADKRTVEILRLDSMIDQLKSENERLRKENKAQRFAAELAGAEAELAMIETAQDAKRYRWAINHPYEFCEILFDYDESGPPSDEKVNRRVAVAMKGGE